MVFGAVLAEQIGLPIPSEPVLLTAGGLVGSGRLHLLVLLAVAGLASLIGDTICPCWSISVARESCSGRTRL